MIALWPTQYSLCVRRKFRGLRENLTAIHHLSKVSLIFACTSGLVYNGMLIYRSSIQGISFLQTNSFISTSTDQRLTRWRFVEQRDESARLERMSSLVTSVADVADMAVLSDNGDTPGETLVAISGIGLEVLAVTV
jgi:hypothetical protein